MSVGSACSIRRRKNRRHEGTGMEIDIYVAYSEDNLHMVAPILDYLRDQGVSVYDPHTDGRPNESNIKAWVDRGIYRAKKTVLFLTKMFLSCEACAYQANMAVIRYVHTWGFNKHRVLVVELESCHVPKYLRYFKQVYAWKYRESPELQLDKIHREVTADPKCRIRIGKHTFPTPFAGFPHPRKSQSDISAIQKTVKYHELLLNFNRLKVSLDNCQMSCKSEGCKFTCDGTDFNKFYLHVKTCKQQKVRCKYCNQFVLQRNIRRHEQEKCPHKRITCQNENCNRLFSLKDFEAHKRKCGFQEMPCPNNVRGCTHVFAKKDRDKHLEICDYVSIQCVSCSGLYFRIDIYGHACRNAMPNHMQLGEEFSQNLHTDRPETFHCRNRGCNFSGVYHMLTDHDKVCEYKIQQCDKCGERLPKHQLQWHVKVCDQMIECETCQMMIPQSAMSTHERYSCCRVNMVRLCTICHTRVNRTDHDSICSYNNSTVPEPIADGLMDESSALNRGNNNPLRTSRTQTTYVQEASTPVSSDHHGEGTTLQHVLGAVADDSEVKSSVSENYIDPKTLRLGKITKHHRDMFNKIMNMPDNNRGLFERQLSRGESLDIDSVSICRQSEYYRL